jgi:hypothetical protein
MPEFDPDTEDRRPDRERMTDEDAAVLFDDDDVFDEAASHYDLFDDEYDRVELALDDLRDMEGPDA